MDHKGIGNERIIWESGEIDVRVTCSKHSDGTRNQDSPGWHGYVKMRHWVTTSRRDFLFDQDNARKKAIVWASIMEESGIRKMNEDPDLIPTDIAMHGKPTIGGYLFAAHDFSKREVAIKLDVRVETVDQYLRNIASSRR